MGGTCQKARRQLAKPPRYYSVTEPITTYHEEMVDLESLNGFEILRQIELGEHNDLVAAPRPAVSDDHEGVDVAEGQEPQLDLRFDALFLSAIRLKKGVLHGVRNHVPMRYHDGFLALCFSIQA